MSRIVSLGCSLVLFAGCVPSSGQSSSTVGSRFVTSVTWDADHHAVVQTREQAITSAHPDWIGSDPACGANDLQLTDKLVIITAGSNGGGGNSGTGTIDPTSNVLCLTNPGDTESVSLRSFPYPIGTGQTWAHRVVGYIGGEQDGGFFNDGQDPGIAPFDYQFPHNFAANLPPGIQNANGVEFDMSAYGPTQCDPVTTGTYQCIGTVLQHCDTLGQWQNSVDCNVAGLDCDAAIGNCSCPPATCSAGSCGTKKDACGASVNCGECEGYAQTCVNNQCKTVSCHCAKGFICDPDGACIRL